VPIRAIPTGLMGMIRTASPVRATLAVNSRLNGCQVGVAAAMFERETVDSEAGKSSLATLLDRMDREG